MVTVIVATPLPVPEAGEGAIQGVLSLIDQVSVPPPLFVMATVCAGGLLPPCWAVKARLVGLMPMAGETGAAAETVNVTGTVTEDAPLGHSVTWPL